MKQLHILSLFILTLCSATSAIAQQSTQETEKKVVIINKTVDENGEFVVEKIVRTGDETEMVDVVKKDCETIKIECEKARMNGDAGGVMLIGDDDTRHVYVDVQQENGHRTYTLKVDDHEEVFELAEGEELTDEQKERLHEHGFTVYNEDGDMHFGSDMVIHVEGDEKAKDRIRMIKERFGDKDFDFDYDFDFDHDYDYKWKGSRHLNCAALGVYVSGGSARVTSIIGSGGAEAAGIQAGDRIMSINGHETNNGQLHGELGKYEPGDEVTVGYERDGQIHTAQVTLTSWTDLPAFADSPRHAAVKCGEEYEEYAYERPRYRNFSKKINCAALGVYVDSDDGQLEISSLIDEGGAEAAGLREGDIISGIDKTPVGSHGELLKVLSEYEPGDIVTVDYERDGKSYTVQSTLTSWTDLPAFADSPRHAAIKCGDENYQGEYNFLEETSRKVIIIKKGQDAVVEEETPPATVNQPPAETIAFDNTLTLQNFVTYPNPTDGKFRVEFSAEAMPIVVSIVDVTGKEVFRDNMDQFHGYYNREINLKDEARGAFILSIEQDGKIFTEQVILH